VRRAPELREKKMVFWPTPEAKTLFLPRSVGFRLLHGAQHWVMHGAG
jgi:hypothetical protein